MENRFLDKEGNIDIADALGSFYKTLEGIRESLDIIAYELQRKSKAEDAEFLLNQLK